MKTRLWAITKDNKVVWGSDGSLMMYSSYALANLLCDTEDGQEVKRIIVDIKIDEVE